MSRSPELPSGVPVPPHVYVPGLTPRHPDNWFDAIKASVTSDTDPAELHQTAAFKVGIAYLGAGYFWECHEVLEPVWFQTRDPSPERNLVQALIQLANARLKLRMQRPHAALRLCDMVGAHLARCPSDREILGLSPNLVRKWTEETRDQIE